MITLKSNITGSVTATTKDPKTGTVTITVQNMAQAPRAGSVVAIFEIDRHLPERFKEFLEKEFVVETSQKRVPPPPPPPPTDCGTKVDS